MRARCRLVQALAAAPSPPCSGPIAPATPQQPPQRAPPQLSAQHRRKLARPEHPAQLIPTAASGPRPVLGPAGSGRTRAAFLTAPLSRAAVAGELLVLPAGGGDGGGGGGGGGRGGVSGGQDSELVRQEVHAQRPQGPAEGGEVEGPGPVRVPRLRPRACA